jgi:hypothetical protein
MSKKTDFDKLSEILGQPNPKRFAKNFRLPVMTMYKAQEGKSASFPKFLMWALVIALEALPIKKRKKIIEEFKKEK